MLAAFRLHLRFFLHRIPVDTYDTGRVRVEGTVIHAQPEQHVGLLSVMYDFQDIHDIGQNSKMYLLVSLELGSRLWKSH